MKYIIYLITSLYSVGFVFGQTVHIKGYTEQIRKGKIYIVDKLYQQDTLAIGKIKNHQCNFEGYYPKFQPRDIAVVSYIIDTETQLLSGIFFIANNQSCEFVMDNNAPHIQYSGSEDFVKINDFLDSLAIYQKQYADLENTTVKFGKRALDKKLNKYLYEFTSQHQDTHLVDVCLSMVLQLLQMDFIMPEYLRQYQQMIETSTPKSNLAEMLSVMLDKEIAKKK